MKYIKFKNSYKIILFVISTLFYISCIEKKQKKFATSRKLSTLSFSKDLHDFREIPQKNEAAAIFNFSNTGKSPLVISEVKTSCGCTVPEYPKGIIKPNETGEIKVIYDAKYPGRFNKTITVFYNGKDSPKTLTIKGEVPYPKDLDSTNN